MKVSLEVAMKLPTPQLNEHPMSRTRRIKRQRRTIRTALEVMAKPIPFPVVVTLIRISTRTADTDRAALSMSAVRDEVARWLGGLPFETVDPQTGKRSTPRAPDGPNDPITWRYGQQRTKKKGFQGVRITIEPDTRGCDR